ncbi:MAG: amino acid permease [Anaerolineaceae bacterium]|jgi:amino acid transporter|nr:amino acid permease [Anaerolineaceae bacterium]
MSESNAVEKKGKGFKKVMRGLDMTLFTVCAILVIDTLAPSAAIGPSSISWWLITLVLFFIPYGLITAELGTAYPDQGGLYIWVKKAFGEKWAARTTWLYWINVALWMPAVYVLFAGMFAQLFAPDLGLWGQILIGVVMTWVTVWIGVKTLETSKWVPNIGAIFKALIMVVIGVAAFIFAGKNGVANDLSFGNLLPTWDAGLFFLPVIVYNFMGFELMSGAGDEIKNPGKDIPRAIIISGLLITVFYMLGTIGMLMALPVEDLGLVDGIIDTLRILLGETGFGGLMVTVLGIGALYSFLANMVTWTTGANKTAAEAADEGELPAFFGRLHPVNKSPVGAFVLTGIISSIVIVAYGLMAGSNEDLFWTLFAFSSMVFLLPYLALFPAFLKLRKIDPDRERPYRVPGGNGLAWVMVVVCMLFIVQAIVFFIWVPGEPIDWAYAAPVLIGVALTLVAGEILLIAAKKNKKS